MSKLSTADIKKMICSWLNKEELKEILKNYYVQDSDSQEHIDRYANYLGMLSGLSVEQIRAKIWSQWIDGNQWKRCEKRRLKEEWESWFYLDHEKHVYTFAEDFCGGENSELIAELAKDTSNFEKCWHRCFVPQSEVLGDNFRLEVVTDANDEQVVGWTVVVD